MVRTPEPAGSFHLRNLRTTTLEEMVGAHRESLPNHSGHGHTNANKKGVTIPET